MKRFNIHAIAWDEHPNGEWVRYSDAARIRYESDVLRIPVRAGFTPRWDIQVTEKGIDVRSSSSGGWVLWDDVAMLIRERDALRQEYTRMRAEGKP